MMNGNGEQLNHDEASLHQPAEAADAPEASSAKNAAITTAATVGVVAVGAVIFEAALIPGMIIGVAAALAPSYMPRLGSALNPLFRSTVRSAYKMGRKTREAMSEAREQMSDIVAEVNAEGTGATPEAPVAQQVNKAA